MDPNPTLPGVSLPWTVSNWYPFPVKKTVTVRIIVLSELCLSCELSKLRTVLGILELITGVRVRAVIRGLAVWPTSQRRYFLKQLGPSIV